MEEYKKRLTEVDVILGYLSDEDYKKIPYNIIQFIKENKDDNYIWSFDETKPLKDQNLSRDTIAILSYINIEYLLNDEQKKYMKKIHEINEKGIKNKETSVGGNIKNSDDLFNKKIINQKDTTDLKVVEVKKNFFSKLFDRIKSFFYKK